MTTRRRWVAGRIFFLAGLLAMSSVAQARNLGGWAGHPLDNDDWACYQEDHGGMRYTALGTHCSHGRWEVPLPIDSTGAPAKTISFVSEGTAHLHQGCTAYGVNVTSLTMATDGPVGNNTPLFKSADLHVTVPTDGTLFLACDGLVPSSSFITQISWTP